MVSTMLLSNSALCVLWICTLAEDNVIIEESLDEIIKEENAPLHKRSFHKSIFNIPKLLNEDESLVRQKRTVDGGQMAPLPMTSNSGQGSSGAGQPSQTGSGGYVSSVSHSYNYGSQGAADPDVDTVQSHIFVNPGSSSSSSSSQSQYSSSSSSSSSGSQSGQGGNQGQGSSNGQGSGYQIFPRRSYSQTHYVSSAGTGSSSQPSTGTGSSSQTYYQSNTGGTVNNAGRTGWTSSGTPYYVAYAGNSGTPGGRTVTRTRTTQTQYVPSSSSQVYSSSGSQQYGNPSSSGSQYYVNPSNSNRGRGSSQITTTYQGVSSGSSFVPNTGAMSNDPNCPAAGYDVFINNMDCNTAVNTLGRFICYNYERVSRACCQKCLAVKTQSSQGCEYGDRSNQCRNLERFLCYEARNSGICCETCARYRRQQVSTQPNCEYGDMTPRCNDILQRRHLCYLPENQRLCCHTCPRVADNSNPGCRWGDQNPELCQLHDSQGALRINCYQSSVRQVCCNSCQRLQARYTNRVAGCQYGDRPVSFSTTQGIMSCRQYVRHFGMTVCDYSDVASHCCFTCHRYRTSQRRQQRSRS